MEETRKKLRIFLVSVVVTAVIFGLVYYFRDVKSYTPVSEGTLIAVPVGVSPWL